MFDSVRNNKKIVQIFLGLITLPFAFFGIDSYVKNAGAGHDMASVGDTKISIVQFDQAVRERQDQLRQQLGANFKPEMLNTPEAKLAVLNSLIDQRVLLLEAQKRRLGTPDEVLRDVISKIPALQEDGKFSMARYESALRAQGMSEQQFEAKLRQDLTLQQLIGAVGETAFVSDTQAEAVLRMQTEVRRYSELRFAPEQFASQVKIDAQAVQKYYDDNKARFAVPEQVRAEYLVLSLDALRAQVEVADADAKAWYDAHQDRYQQSEERRASHILIVTNGDVDKEKAKAKAEEVLKEVKASPAKFAELAKQHSQDPGSAKNGGDLGYFGRGMMVKPFEDIVFSQKEGEISEIVQSDFGYHIIKVTGIKPAKVRPFEEVRADIVRELKTQAATRKFAEAAEAFNNTVYEQSESLAPAAEKFKLKVEKSPLVTRTPDPKALAALGPLASEKVLGALFSEDAIKNKRNTEAVEVAPNTLVAARVVEHVPASTLAFDAVKADVEKLLIAQQEQELAKAAGEARLEELRKGASDDAKAAWSAAKSSSRMQARDLPAATVQAIFKADVKKLPAYAGAVVDGGYTLYRIDKVDVPAQINVDQRKGLQREYGAIVAQQDLAAYLTALRQRYKIDINHTALESKPQ